MSLLDELLNNYDPSAIPEPTENSAAPAEPSAAPGDYTPMEDNPLPHTVVKPPSVVRSPYFSAAELGVTATEQAIRQREQESRSRTSAQVFSDFMEATGQGGLTSPLPPAAAGSLRPSTSIGIRNGQYSGEDLLPGGTLDQQFPEQGATLSNALVEAPELGRQRNAWGTTALNSLAIGTAPVTIGVAGATAEPLGLAGGMRERMGAGRSVFDNPNESWIDRYSRYYQAGRRTVNESREQVYDDSVALGLSADVAGALPGTGVTAARFGIKAIGALGKVGTLGMADAPAIAAAGRQIDQQLISLARTVGKYAPANAIDNAFAHAVRGTGNAFSSVMLRLGAAASAAGLVTGIEEGISSDFDLNRMGDSLGAAMIWGMGGQLAGEVMTPFAQLFSSDRAAMDFIRRILPRVSTPDSNPDTIREQIENLRPGDTISVMGSPQRGRRAPGVSQLRLPGPDDAVTESATNLSRFFREVLPNMPSNTNPGFRRFMSQQYGQLMSRTENALAGLTGSINNSVVNTVQNRTTGATWSEFSAAAARSRQPYGEVLRSIRSNAPLPNGRRPYGAYPVDIAGAIDAVRRSALTDNRDILSVSSLSDTQKGLLRQTLRTMRRIPRADRQTLGLTDDQTTIERLYRARSDLQGRLGARDTQALTSEDRAFATSLIRSIDGQIDEVLDGVSGDARAAYSQARQIEDIYTDFRDMYRSTTFNMDNPSSLDLRDPTSRMNWAERLDAIEAIEDPAVRQASLDAAREGFKAALGPHIGQRGFANVMNHLVGPVENLNRFEGITGVARHGGGSTPQDNLVMLRRILGDDDTDALLTAYQLDSANELMLENLDMLRAFRRNEPLPSGGDSRLRMDSSAIQKFADRTVSAVRKLTGTDLDYGVDVLRLFTDPTHLLKTRLLSALDRATGASPVYGAKVAATESYEDREDNPEALNRLNNFEEYVRNRITSAVTGERVDQGEGAAIDMDELMNRYGIGGGLLRQQPDAQP